MREIDDAQFLLNHMTVDMAIVQANGIEKCKVLREIWKDAELMASRSNGIHTLAIMGGNQCVRAGTLIDTPSGKVPIEKFIGGKVRSWDGDYEVWAKAGKSFVKGYEEFYKVTFTNGKSIEVTKQHRFLGMMGWMTLEKLASLRPEGRKVKILKDGKTEIVEITKITRTEPDIVWDISVEKTECYTSNGILCHNSGKSYTGSKVFSRLVSDTCQAGDTIWCISPSKEKSIGTQQRYLWNDLPRGMIADNTWTEKNGFGAVNPMLILEPEGRRITVKFKTVAQYYDDPNAFESETLAGMWIDEAVPHEVWQALQMRVAVKNGWILMSTIPSIDWMWEEIENGESSGLRMHKLLPRDNPAMTEEALQRMSDSITDPVERAMRLEGKFAMLDGLVFPEFDMEKHVLDKVPDEPMSFYAGMDVGLDHPTTWLLIGATKSGKYIVLHEYGSRRQTPQEDAVQIKPLLEKYQLAQPTYIDPSAFRMSKGQPSCVGLQYIQAGLPVQPAASYSEWNRIVQMKEMLRNGELLVMRGCSQLIRELRVWKFKRNRANQPMNGDMMEDKNNDFIDSVKYCVSMQPPYVRDGVQNFSGVQIGA